MKKLFFIGFAVLAILLIVLGIYLYFEGRGKSLQPPVAKNKPSVSISSCRVLPEEYCKNGKLINKKIEDKEYTYIGLNVPAGTPIYALTSGQLAKTQESGQFFSGFGGQIINPEQTGASLIKGDIVYETMVYETVEEGQQIAVVGDRGIENLGGYNFIFTVNKRVEAESISDIEFLKTLFNK